MGFQFNHVGGGTKTRRPVRLEMHFDPNQHEPRCELANENEENRFEEKTLEEVQAHIASQNEELEERNQFSEKDIIVRVHFEFSPNITIIDTPGAVFNACVIPTSHYSAELITNTKYTVAYRLYRLGLQKSMDALHYFPHTL